MYIRDVKRPSWGAECRFLENQHGMQASSEDEKMNIGLETLQGLFATWTQAIALQQAASQETPDPNQPAEPQQPPDPNQPANPQQPPYADGYMLSHVQ